MTAERVTIAQAWDYVESVWNDVVDDIDSLVRIESVEDISQANPGMPFGPGPCEALKQALGIARKLGLVTVNHAGYFGYADVRGEREEHIATIAHADIVPLGPGWTVDPLRVTHKDGYLLGRGVIDDKGPLVLTLYAAHFFTRQATSLPYTLRCIIGANEETGMRDVDKYLSCEPQPLFCFTPDAGFPLICGEKGRFFACVSSAEIPSQDGVIVSMEGGVASNAVPGTASAVVRAQLEDLNATDGVDVVPAGHDNDGAELLRMTAHGLGGHAATPEGTENAIGMLVKALLASGLCTGPELEFLLFQQALLTGTHGHGLGIDAEDDAFGPLTCVGGTVHTINDDKVRRFEQTIDVRYPMSTTGERILRRIDEVAASHGCRVVSHDDTIPFYLPPDAEDVRTLVETFQEVTGRSEGAFTIGGGTYARHFERAVAFGPEMAFEPSPEWVGQEHGPDEGIAEQTLKRALVTYILAIDRLMRLSW